jgi:hypothetical protein
MRSRVSRLVSTLTAIALLVGACGDPAVPREAPEATLSANLSFTCGEIVVPAAALSAPEGAESADTPAASALFAYLGRRDPKLEDMPRTGYRVLSAGEDRVVFATSVVGTSGLTAIAIQRDAAGWKAAGIGSCEPLLSLPGLNAATWHLPDDAPLPAPGALGFVALVSETACTSGRSADGRVLPPVIVREPARVLVVFAVRPPPPASPGGLEACPAPPPTRIEVQLGAPLGNRELLDGGVFPPRDVQSLTCCG